MNFSNIAVFRKHRQFPIRKKVPICKMPITYKALNFLPDYLNNPKFGHNYPCHNRKFWSARILKIFPIFGKIPNLMSKFRPKFLKKAKFGLKLPKNPPKKLFFKIGADQNF